MLDIKKIQSKNECTIVGILNELDIVEGKTSDVRDYIRGTATIRVDQEVEGKQVENLIPVSMFAMRLKKDGSQNSIYDKIADYKESLTSAAAAETISQASRVSVVGKTANLVENMWVDKRTGAVRTGFQISSNFINSARESDKDAAKFEVTGVVLGMRPEQDKEGEETGRLIVNIGLVGYAGKVDVIETIAEDNAKSFIEDNWNKSDTVTVAGIINMTQKVTTYTEEVGFGEPIVRHRTESCRELLITAGSREGADEDHAYDEDDIKAALKERQAKKEALLNKSKSKPAAKSTSEKADSFGF